jgi:alpha-glucosidase
VPPERHVDPSGGRRDGCRAPIPWTPEPAHGWASADPWLPFPPEPDVRNAATLVADPASIVHLYRALLHARRSSPALQLGSIEVVQSPDDTLVYERSDGDDARTVAINFRPEPVAVDLTDLTVDVSSDPTRAPGNAFSGTLAAFEAVVLVLR